MYHINLWGCGGIGRHVHLIPINNMDDMSFDTKISMTDSQFNETMNKIKSYI